MSNNTFDQMKLNQLNFLQEVLVNHAVAMKKKDDSFVIKILIEGNFEVEPNLETGEWDVLNTKKVFAKYKMVIPMNLVSENGFELFFGDCHVTVTSTISNVRQFLIAIQNLPDGEWTVGEEVASLVATQKVLLYEVF